MKLLREAPPRLVDLRDAALTQVSTAAVLRADASVATHLALLPHLVASLQLQAPVVSPRHRLQCSMNNDMTGQLSIEQTSDMRLVAKPICDATQYALNLYRT